MTTGSLAVSRHTPQSKSDAVVLSFSGVQGCDIRRAPGWRKYNCVTRGFDLVERFGPFSFRLQYRKLIKRNYRETESFQNVPFEK